MSQDPTVKRPLAFWILVVFLGLSVPLMLVGQTLSIFDYELSSRLGLQEDVEEVGEYGVHINRAYAVADTLIYLPLILMSLVGLILRRRWALLTTAAFAGVSLYWTVTTGAALLLLPGTPGYAYQPGIEIWLLLGAYLVVGAWALVYLTSNGERLLDWTRKNRLADLLLVD